MEAYIADKRLMYADQDASCWTVCDLDDSYGRSFAKETKARVLAYASSLPEDSYGIEILPGRKTYSGEACLARLPGLDEVELVPRNLSVPGAHARRNIASAALAAWTLGASPEKIAAAAGTFAGIEHRLEYVRDRRGVRWFNDSAATVPEAVCAAVDSFDGQLVLISGGTDKKLEFETARDAYRRCTALILLAGSGTEKIRAILDTDAVPYHGPYNSITEAVARAASIAPPGSTVVMSPGCTSFGMFKNEFDRGRSYKAAVKALPD
jgi:UDP-N-acetylmuramoylalanine--D-glutamate ligase